MSPGVLALMLAAAPIGELKTQETCARGTRRRNPGAVLGAPAEGEWGSGLLTVMGPVRWTLQKCYVPLSSLNHQDSTEEG